MSSSTTRVYTGTDSTGAAIAVDVTVSITPAPIPAPQLTTLTVQPAQIPAGQFVQVFATLSAPALSPVSVALSYLGPGSGPAALVIGVGLTQGSALVATPAAPAGTLFITGSLAGVSRMAALTVTYIPPSPTRLNVRDFGALGNGVTDDTAAIQRCINTATAGAIVWFPEGRYLLPTPLSVQTSGIRLTGEGGNLSQLLHGTRQGFHVGGAGPVVQDVVFSLLTLVGAPGLFNADGNGVSHAFLVDAARNISIEGCRWDGPGHAAYQVNGAQGLNVRNCLVNGYGRVAFGCGDGFLAENNTIIQNYPDPTSRGLDYLFYIHNGAKNVTIRNNRGSGAGGYAVHAWAQAVVGNGGPVLIEGNIFTDCAIGAIFANSPSTAGRIQGLTVRYNQWIGPVRGSCVVIRQCDGGIFEGNSIKSGKPSAAMIDCQALNLGQWGPNDPGGVIRGLTVRNNTFQGWDISLYALASNGGHFENCQIGPGNTIIDCRRQPIISAPSGIVVVP